jgi:Flp pilus assembly protein TadG
MARNTAMRQYSARRRYGRDERGVASIEMGVIFPLMLALFVGLVDISNLMTANRRVTLTASTLGDLVTQSPGDVKVADLKGFISAAGSIMDPFPASSTSLEFFTYTKTSATTAKLDWKYVSGAGCGAAPPADDPDMLQLMAEDNDVVISRACYIWEPVLGIVLGLTSSTVQDQLMLRPRQTARIVCTDCP